MQNAQNIINYTTVILTIKKVAYMFLRQDASKLEKYRVLYICDKEQNISEKNNIARTCDTKIIYASTKEMLKILKRDYINFIIIDLDEPLVLSVISQLKQSSTLLFNKVIMGLSINKSPQFASECFNAGIDNYIVKPLNQKKLNCAIDYYSFKHDAHTNKPYDIAIKQLLET